MKIRLRTPVMLLGLGVVLFLTLFLSAQALSPELAGGMHRNWRPRRLSPHRPWTAPSRSRAR